MATQTTNLGLTKPAGTDKIRIAQINGNMDILDTKIGSVGDTALQAQVSAIENGIAIVSVGNAHAAISSGQFVYVRNHGTLPEGLYTANSAIAANATLSASNVTSTSAGGLNALSDQIATFNTVQQATLNSGITGFVCFVNIGRAVVVTGVVTNANALSTNDVLATGLPRPFNSYTLGDIVPLGNPSSYKIRISDTGNVVVSGTVSANDTIRFTFAYVRVG